MLIASSVAKQSPGLGACNCVHAGPLRRAPQQEQEFKNNPPPPPGSSVNPPWARFSKTFLLHMDVLKPRIPFLSKGYRPKKIFVREEKRSPNPNFLVRISLGGVGGLPREGVGAKKHGMSFETQGNQSFWRDIPGGARKFEKQVCAQFSFPNLWMFFFF